MIKKPLPRRCFEALMSPFADGEVADLKRCPIDGKLLPTSSASSRMRFTYVLNKKKPFDKLFALHEHEMFEPKSVGGGKRAKTQRWKCGRGCARLHSSGAAERREELAGVMAMVCGNVLVEYREPRRHRAMPKLTFKLFVLSMDANGHIVWPANFQDATRVASLRKQALSLLKHMMEDKLYPVAKRFDTAMNQTSSSLLCSCSHARCRPPL
eukprot:6214563-Pleurochrysis_carterae.AAC.5